MDQTANAFRSRFGGRRKVVYFISTGDTCRSPMAGGLLRKLLDEAKVRNVEVRSAGVLTVTGLRASQEARQILESMEVDISRHRSSQLSPEMIRRADLILGMTPYHVQRAVRISEDARPKTFLFKEYTRSDLANIQIADPMGGTLEVFKQRMKEIKKACEMLVKTPFVSGASDDLAPPMTASAEAPAKKKAAAAEARPERSASKPKAEAKPAAAKTKSAPKKAKAAKPKPKSAVKAKPARKLAAKKTRKAKPARRPKPARPAVKVKRPLAQARASAARISRAARLRAAKSKSPLRKLAGRSSSKVKASPKNLSRR